MIRAKRSFVKGEDKIAVCAKTAGLRCGNFSDLNSCSVLEVLVPIKIFQLPDMRNEIERYRDATNSLLSLKTGGL